MDWTRVTLGLSLLLPSCQLQRWFVLDAVQERVPDKSLAVCIPCWASSPTCSPTLQMLSTTRTEERKEEKGDGEGELKENSASFWSFILSVLSSHPRKVISAHRQQPDRGTVRKQEAFSIHFGLAGFLTTSFYSVSRQKVGILHTLTDVKVQTHMLHQNSPAD